MGAVVVTTFVGVGSLASGRETNGTSPTVPAATQAGDTLLACYAGYTTTVTGPQGWPLLANNQYSPISLVWIKTATASDAGSTVTMSVTGGNTNTECIAFVLAYRDISGPINVALPSSSASNTPPALPKGAGAVLSIGSGSNAINNSESGSNLRAQLSMAQSGYGATGLSAADWLPGDSHLAGPLIVNGGVNAASHYITIGLSMLLPLAPTVPALPSKAMVGKSLPVSWTHNDNGSLPQAKAQVRYRKAVV